MHSQALRRFTLALLLCTSAGSVHAQRSLSAFAGVVGGAGNGDINNGCTTYGKPTDLAFFSFSTPFVPTGGIIPCGYSGGYSTVTATNGPLVNTSSLPPVTINPNLPAKFDGTAGATASYGSLGAIAHANISPTSTYASQALFSSIGAATFTDSITAASPFVVAGANGFVRYRFSVDGTLSSLGAPAAYFFGETYAVLDISQNGGPTYEILNATVRRGGSGTISNGTPPAGWTTSTGVLGGKSTFFSLDMPITWGTTWQLKVGLLALAYGTADANFFTTAKITGVELFDAAHAPVTTFNLNSQSGFNYADPSAPVSTTVPEPSSLAFVLLGLACIAGCSVRRRSGGATMT